MAVATFEKRFGGRPRLSVLGVVALASLVASCSSERIFGSSVPSSPPASTPTPVAPTAAAAPAPAPAPATPGASTSVDPLTLFCPAMDVRQGASTLTIPPGATDALNLQYQGTIGDMARECKVANGMVTMKVAVQGRILLGPAGGPGTVDVPLRYAVVREGPVPKFIWSKFYRVSVSIPEGKSTVPFTHIDDAVVFPQPSADEMNSYIVYVGFDPVGDKQQPAPKKPAPKKPAAKPAAAR